MLSGLLGLFDNGQELKVSTQLLHPCHRYLDILGHPLCLKLKEVDLSRKGNELIASLADITVVVEGYLQDSIPGSLGL